MKTNFVTVSILMTILIGGTLGLFIIDDAFAQNLYVSSDDSEAYKKQKELEQKKADQEAKSEEKHKELEQKKAELEIHRKNLEAKQLKKLKEYEEKLIKKSEEIQKKLMTKSDKLDSRTKNILDKINNGTYMGEKTIAFTYVETYELVFDFVNASMINDKSQTSSMTGKMNFTTYDKSKSNLKLELDECEITVDEITYNCGFGKARSVSSGESGAKDSLVIIAFLENDVLEEVHTALKIFLNADIPIDKIEQSRVSIIGPQSKISDSWFLNGTATLSKIVSTSEKTIAGNNSTVILEDGISTSDK